MTQKRKIWTKKRKMRKIWTKKRKIKPENAK